ncbi:hypothetical protein MCHI_002850 [Candidatus Magnetoovum chiemensis]|nr:hypothetical protein MCHI_002850 [Candidatus Magnetoovum chiemensis]
MRCSSFQKSSMVFLIIAPFGCQSISPAPMSSFMLNRSSSLPRRRWSRFLISSRYSRYLSSSSLALNAVP